MSSQAVRYVPHYTVADYETWEGDWELWHGVPVAMPPSPTAQHQFLAANLIREIGNQLQDCDGCDCIVVHETDWRIRDDTVVRPDVAVLCHGLPENYIDYPPTLIAEVLSPATVDKDRTAKRSLYEAEGVRFYLLVDTDNRTIEALELTGARYERRDASDLLEMRWDANCCIRISRSSLFAT